jgi:hypothetical protein
MTKLCPNYDDRIMTELWPNYDRIMTELRPNYDRLMTLWQNYDRRVNSWYAQIHRFLFAVVAACVAVYVGDGERYSIVKAWGEDRTHCTSDLWNRVSHQEKFPHAKTHGGRCRCLTVRNTDGFKNTDPVIRMSIFQWEHAENISTSVSHEKSWKTWTWHNPQK